MNITKKLEAFAKITEKQAESRRQDILREINLKVESAVEESHNAALKKSAEYENEAIKNAQAQCIKEVSIYEGKLKKDYLLKREELRKYVFHLAEEKLNKYVKSDEYFKKLSQVILAHIKSGDISAVEITQLDYNRFLKGNSSIKHLLKITDEDIIGGYKLFFSGDKISMDNTYRCKLSHAQYNTVFKEAY